MQDHLPLRASIDAGSPNDTEGCICAVIVVRAFNGDLAAIKEDRPVAFPFGFPGGYAANTEAIVITNLLLISRVENRIVEAKRVAQRIGWWVKLLHRIRNGMFDNMNSLSFMRLSCLSRVSREIKGQPRDDSREQEYHCRDSNGLLFHLNAPFFEKIWLSPRITFYVSVPPV